MITGYTNFRTVLNKLYRDLNINTEINETYVVSWISEVLDKIGAYAQYTEYKECLDLTDGKALLPCNFYRIKDISFDSQPVAWNSNSIATDYGCDGCTIPKCCTEYEFYINNSYIITNITPTATGVTDTIPKLCIVYLGIPVDEEGYPLIPDDVYYMEACAKYVTYMLDYQEWRKGNIPDKVLNKSETDYLWYVGAARGAANQPSAAQMENLKSVWVRLIPKMDEYNNLFANTNKQERRYRY